MSETLQNLVAAMKVKFAKYWGSYFDEFNQLILCKNKKDYDVNLGIVIASILYPRGKAQYYFYSKICVNADQTSSSVNVAIDWMKKYFVEYERRVRKGGANSITYSSEGNSNTGSPVLIKT
jgi:hypothetical protein